MYYNDLYEWIALYVLLPYCVGGIVTLQYWLWKEGL